MRRLFLAVFVLVWSNQLIGIANGFDAQGHRGARGLAPENTLSSFATALSIGVSTLELDVGVTGDGVIVVTHDPRLKPDTTRDKNGAWLSENGPAIHTLTLKELRKFDVGRLNPATRYQNRFPNQIAVDGASIPTLKEVLLLVECSRNGQVRLNIETKLNPFEPELFPQPTEFVSELLKVVGKHGFLKRVTIQSFDWRTLQEVQDQAPSIPTSYLSAQQSWLDNIQAGEADHSPWTAGFDIDDFEDVPEMVKAAGGRIWSPYYRELSKENLQKAHALGLEVKVWTVNDLDSMEALVSMGVDGIITDYPDRLRRVLDKLAMSKSAPSRFSALNCFP